MEYPAEKANKFYLGRVTILFCVIAFFFAFHQEVRAADEVADATFLVDEGNDFFARSEVDAFLAYESANAHVYFETAAFNDAYPAARSEMLAHVEELGQEFDSVIYPRIKSIFGDEWNPGIDGDEKITILFVRMNYGVGGYFNPADEYKKVQLSDGRSNEREMVYLNPDFLDQQRVEGFLSHELQHMVYWNEKTRIKSIDDDIWLNEGRSELASAIVESELGIRFSSGNLATRKRDFLQHYEDSLVDWNNMAYDYASVSIFMQYLKEQIGTGIFRQMSSNRRIGAANLDYVLSQSKGVSFRKIFTDWTIANYINDRTVDVAYGYQNQNLQEGFRVEAEPIYDKDGNGEIDLTGEIKNWSAGYYKLDLTGLEEDMYLQVDFDGEDAGAFAVPVIMGYRDGSKEVDHIVLDSKQNGLMEISSLGHAISYVIFIPSVQKLDDPLISDQADSRYISMSVRLDSVQDRVRPDGTLIKTAQDERIYLVEDSKKRWITSSAAFVSNGYDWGKVLIVSEAEMAIYVSGEDIGVEPGALAENSLVQGSGPRVYLIEGGRRRWISDERTFVSSGFKWNEIIRVTDQELLRYVEGDPITNDDLTEGMLFKSVDNPKVYALRSGKKCWITTPEAFARNGFVWSSIKEITSGIIASYADGPNID